MKQKPTIPITDVRNIPIDLLKQNISDMPIEPFFLINQTILRWKDSPSTTTYIRPSRYVYCRYFNEACPSLHIF